MILSFNLLRKEMIMGLFKWKRKEEKYINEIKRLKNIISNMRFEWDEEKDLYDDKMKEDFYNLKVSYILNGIDVEHSVHIRRPLMNITVFEAAKICSLCSQRLHENELLCSVYIMPNTEHECLEICIDYLGKNKL